MDLKDSQVKGGVFIVHQVHEGKHQYVVDNVMPYKHGTAQKTFVRGDKLMQVNDMDLEDVQPEKLVSVLAEGNPKLKVHKAFKAEVRHKQPSPTMETLYPISKHIAMLRLSMEMTKEDNEVGQNGGRDKAGLVDDKALGGKKKRGEERDLFVITMEKTSISVVTGRGCDSEDTCFIADVVMVSESCTVKLVPRGSFRQDTPVNASIEHLQSHQYIRAMSCGKHIYASPNPEQITIYHYRSNFTDKTFRGMPVVLKFTGTNLFVRCYKDGDRARLQAETCEKQRLKQITTSDEEALSFVFYMKSDSSRIMKFESALYSGWFIQMVNTDTDSAVKMATMAGQTDDPSFFFIIKK